MTFPRHTLFAIALCLSHTASFAQERVIAGDGKQYQLNQNGTWELVSDERILDTEDGRRVVLKPDGTWLYLGLVPVQESNVFQNLTLAAAIEGIEIEVLRESAGPSKNTRVASQTRVTLSLNLATTATHALDLTALDPARFTLSDNRGTRYPIEAFDSASAQLEPGESSKLVLLSNKAPKGFKKLAEMTLNVEKHALGNDQTMTLRYDYDRVVHTRLNK